MLLGEEQKVFYHLDFHKNILDYQLSQLNLE